MPALLPRLRVEGIGWEYFLRFHPDVPQRLRLPSLKWDGVRFYTKAALAVWLEDHGQRWSNWARQHPLSARRLGRAPFSEYVTLTAPLARTRDGGVGVRAATFTHSHVTLVLRDGKGTVLARSRVVADAIGRVVDALRPASRLRDGLTLAVDARIGRYRAERVYTVATRDIARTG